MIQRRPRTIRPRRTTIIDPTILAEYGRAFEMYRKAGVILRRGAINRLDTSTTRHTVEKAFIEEMQRLEKFVPDFPFDRLREIMVSENCNAEQALNVLLSETRLEVV